MLSCLSILFWKGSAYNTYIIRPPVRITSQLLTCRTLFYKFSFVDFSKFKLNCVKIIRNLVLKCILTQQQQYRKGGLGSIYVARGLHPLNMGMTIMIILCF